MQLDPRPAFLVVHDNEESDQLGLSIVAGLNEAIDGWSKASRLSPIWRLAVSGSASRAGAPLSSQCHLTFLGPVRPARLTSEIEGIDAAKSIWATLGIFNIIVETGSDDAGKALSERIAAWAQANKIAHEQWKLVDGKIEYARHHVLPHIKSKVLEKITSFSDIFRHPAVHSSFEENLVASATGLARSAAVYPAIYDEIEAALDSTAEIMRLHSKGEMSLHDMQSRLLTMNAALSRFSSQAFSGIPPIVNTECHFWTHSLLGTGSANIALASLVASVQKVLGEARLRERLSALGQETSKVPSSTELLSDIKLLEFDLLRAVQLPSTESKPVVPLVTYFSGRDGFSSHINTLSAPLTTLAECNSLRSNLLTVTHEISHIFIQSALAELSPTLGVRADIDVALSLLQPKAQPRSWLEAAKQLFLEAIVSITIDDEGRKPHTLQEIERDIASIVERTRRDVQEIMVHTFDFLYFHAADPKYYITSIWHSWCAIPGIQDRIPEYLIRTLCAVSSTLLTTTPKTRFAAALRDLKSELTAIEPTIGMTGNYVGHALAYINSLEGDKGLYERFERRYSVRMRLVRLVYIFMYSKTLAARLFHDPHIGGGEGYRAKKSLNYDLNPVGNPLQFLRVHLKAAPSEAESMWVLHALAFDLAPPPLGES